MPAPLNPNRQIQPIDNGLNAQAPQQLQRDQLNEAPRLGNASHNSLQQPGSDSSLTQLELSSYQPEPRLSQLINQHDFDHLALPTYELVEQAQTHFQTMKNLMQGLETNQASRPAVLKLLDKGASKREIKQHIISVTQYLVDQHPDENLNDVCGPNGVYTNNLLKHLNTNSKGLIGLINLTKEYAHLLDNPDLARDKKFTALIQFPPKAASDLLCVDGSKETVNAVIEQLNTDTQQTEIFFGIKESILELAEKAIIKHMQTNGWFDKAYPGNHKHLPGGAWVELGVSKKLVNDISIYIAHSLSDITAPEIHKLSQNIGQDVAQALGQYIESDIFKGHLNSLESLLIEYVSLLNDAYERGGDYSLLDQAVQQVTQHPLGLNFVDANGINIERFAKEDGPDDNPYQINIQLIKQQVIDQMQQAFGLEESLLKTGFKELEAQFSNNPELNESIFSNNLEKQYNTLSLLAQLGGSAKKEGSDRLIFMKKIYQMIAHHSSDKEPLGLRSFQKKLKSFAQTLPSAHKNLTRIICDAMHDIQSNPDLSNGIHKLFENKGRSLSHAELVSVFLNTQSSAIIREVFTDPRHLERTRYVITNQGPDYDQLKQAPQAAKIFKSFLKQAVLHAPFAKDLAFTMADSPIENIQLITEIAQFKTLNREFLSLIKTDPAKQLLIHFATHNEYDQAVNISAAHSLAIGHQLSASEIFQLESNNTSTESSQLLDRIYSRLKTNHFTSLQELVDAGSHAHVKATAAAILRNFNGNQAREFIDSDNFIKLLYKFHFINKEELVTQFLDHAPTTPHHQDLFEKMTASFVASENNSMTTIFKQRFPNWKTNREAQYILSKNIKNHSLTRVKALMMEGVSPCVKYNNRPHPAMELLILNGSNKNQHFAQASNTMLVDILQYARVKKLPTHGVDTKAVMTCAIKNKNLDLAYEAFFMGANLPPKKTNMAFQNSFKEVIDTRSKAIRAEIKSISKSAVTSEQKADKINQLRQSLFVDGFINQTQADLDKKLLSDLISGSSTSSKLKHLYSTTEQDIRSIAQQLLTNLNNDIP